ncbi:hypothetical protein SAMN04488005_1620 [Yoonia tamlensis]|uniref:Uncharacterized protein n=1 Tax=Yoonia tamlensis TaxID=390270 RepID=A0A1I6GGM6_9RHOB|nr:hypothetical protein [Yoonia tamlensis]SFR41227.1 hypothetical protein SAMN04488005_1620 [Yoonia tamlensis]
MAIDPIDPTGLIAESFLIANISEPECRTIFLEWAMGISADVDTLAAVKTHLARHSNANPAHPMIATLNAALETARPPKRRGGRRARVSE